MQDDWRGVDFPRDREVLLQIDLAVPAYWDKDLACWVLSTPVHIETVHRPKAWKPKPGPAIRQPVCQCIDVCVIPQGQPQPVATCRGLERQVSATRTT